MAYIPYIIACYFILRNALVSVEVFSNLVLLIGYKTEASWLL